jgi:hypothetical protein
MVPTAAILDLVSVDYLTNTWDTWSEFFVVYWGDSDWRKVPFNDHAVPLLIQDGHCGMPSWI